MTKYLILAAPLLLGCAPKVPIARVMAIGKILGQQPSPVEIRPA
jgi:hypothetical protein